MEVNYEDNNYDLNYEELDMQSNPMGFDDYKATLSKGDKAKTKTELLNIISDQSLRLTATVEILARANAKIQLQLKDIITKIDELSAIKEKLQPNNQQPIRPYPQKSQFRHQNQNPNYHKPKIKNAKNLNNWSANNNSNLNKNINQVNKNNNQNYQIKNKINNQINDRLKEFFPKLQEQKETINKELANITDFNPNRPSIFNTQGILIKAKEDKLKFSSQKSSIIHQTINDIAEHCPPPDQSQKQAKLVQLSQQGVINLDPDTQGINLLELAKLVATDKNIGQGNEQVPASSLNCVIHQKNNMCTHSMAQCNALKGLYTSILDTNSKCFLHPFATHTSSQCLTLSAKCLHHQGSHQLAACPSFGVFFKLRLRAQGKNKKA